MRRSGFGRRRQRTAAVAVTAVALLSGALTALTGVARAAAPPPVGKLTSSAAAAYDGLGTSVAASGDTVVVGAPHDDDAGVDAGSVSLFTPDGVGGHTESKLTASDTSAGDGFGGSVAMSGDTIVIGASGDDDGGATSGAAYVFQPDGSGGYTETKLVASDAAPDDRFGFSVAVSGDTIVVGAYGDDGARSFDYYHGSAYVFAPDGLGGYVETKLPDAAPLGEPRFGWSVAVSDATIVVGAYAGGSAYVFTPDGPGGYSVATLTASDSPADFGWSVGVSGGIAVVGTWADDGAGYASGAAYVFTPDGLGGYAETKVTAFDAAAGARFGWAVAMSGSTILVGSPWDRPVGSSFGPKPGSMYLLEPDGVGGYTQSRVTAPDVPDNDFFGQSVAVAGSTLAGGAPNDDDGGTNSGAAYVFGSGSGAAAVPGAPTVVAAVVGDGAATVSWTAPASDGGSAIIGYYVTPIVGYWALKPIWFSSTATIQTVSALVPGTTYRFRVAARNGVGAGADSTVTNPVIPTANVPGPPTIGVAISGDGRATVSWTPPAGTATVTAYVVTAYIGYFPARTVSFSSTATAQTVTGLTNGTSYRFRVQAANTVGTSGYSRVSNEVTPSA